MWVTPPTLIVKLLKSLTEELVPNATLEIEAVAAKVGVVDVPATAPEAPALGVKPTPEMVLPDSELKLKAPLTTFTWISELPSRVFKRL